MSILNSSFVSGKNNELCSDIVLKAKTLCNMKRYKDALNVLQNADSSSKTISNLIKGIELNLHQQENGDYDLQFLYSKSQSCPSYRFDFADFAGPVEIQDSPGKGRGLFATKHICPGQLIIGNKAFAINFAETDSSTSRSDKQNISAMDSKELVEQIAKIIEEYPHKSEGLYKLYDGNEYTKVSTKNLVDKYKIERICRLNAFAGSKTATGLWLLPSYINHSCVGCNCNWTVFGDFMLIRAFKPITKDQEILISYVAPDEVYSVRLDSFQRHRFVCDCVLCLLDQSESQEVHERRDESLRNFKRFQSNNILCYQKIAIRGNQKPIPFLRDILNQLNHLRKRQDLNPHIIEPLNRLALELFKNGEYGESALLLERLFCILENYPFSKYLLDTAFGLVRSYVMAGDKDTAVEWLLKLKTSAVSRFGSVDDVIEMFGGNFVQFLLDNGINLSKILSFSQM